MNLCLREQEVTSIVSDVPLVAVGIMALGIFMFLTAMRRASVLNVVLFAASFLIFGAAIIDLSKIVAEAENTIVAGRATHRLGAVRDVGLACSVGLIYLFMWLFVAERPQAESQTDLSQSQVQVEHSGTWRRWGLPGEFLKWLSLSLCFLTPLLRILWHILIPFRVRDSLLVMNAIVEIVLSAIFIIKLILNMSLVHHALRWKSLRDYLAPIIAMGISTVLALGNLVIASPVFTDTTAGRLLFSIELYILLLFALISTFYEDIKSIVNASVDREEETVGQKITGKCEQCRRSMMLLSWTGPQRTQSVDWRTLGVFRNIENRLSRQATSIRASAAVPEGASPLQPRGLDLNAVNEYDWSPVCSKPLPDLPDGVDSSSLLSSFSLHSSGDSSLSTFARILRQHDALEKTLSKLKDLHHLSAVDDPSSAQGATDAVQSPISASASDFSLSRFPEPPQSTVQPPSPRFLATRRAVRKSRRKATYFPSIIATTMEDTNPRHESLGTSNDVPDGHESAVWQYDVTSFIDNLTTPSPSTTYSDSTWRVAGSKERIVTEDEQESPLATLSGLETQSDRGPRVKVRPRPPPIQVPGA